MKVIEFQNGPDRFVATGPTESFMAVARIIGKRGRAKTTERVDITYPACLRFMPYAKVGTAKTMTAAQARAAYVDVASRER